MIGLSVIVPSSGRPSLRDTIDSVSGQLRPGDQLLVDVRDDVPWGNALRQRMMERAFGDSILFMDDDDTYVPHALDLIRTCVNERPWHVHMFQMQYIENGFRLFQDEEVRCGNVAAQMVCVPNVPPWLGRWGDRYEGDFDFIESTCRVLGEPVWHRDVIAMVRHPRLKGLVGANDQ